MRSHPRELPKVTAYADAFTPAVIASDASWLPDTGDCEEPPASVDAFAQAYLADPDAWHWSTALINGSRDTVLKRALAIIAHARLPGHEKALGQLGAGPLEDMMSDSLLDHLSAWTPFSDGMRYALKCVRMEVETPDLQNRLRAMLGL